MRRRVALKRLSIHRGTGQPASRSSVVRSDFSRETTPLDPARCWYRHALDVKAQAPLGEFLGPRQRRDDAHASRVARRVAPFPSGAGQGIGRFGRPRRRPPSRARSGRRPAPIARSNRGVDRDLVHRHVRRRPRPRRERGPVPTARSARHSGRGDRIRTCDLLVPNQALYQAKLHPGHTRRTLGTVAKVSMAPYAAAARATAAWTSRARLG